MIVKELIKEGYCFAVIQSYSYLTKAKLYENREWEIIALEKDYQSLSGFGFSKNNCSDIPMRHRNPEGILSRVMDLKEITEFKSQMEDYFIKVLSTSDGKVWELKNNSFKDRYNERFY